jgi:CheY-like chemotaxis protein
VEKIKCAICGKDDFKTQYGLTQHTNQKHSSAEVATEGEVKPGQPQTMAVIKRQQSPLEVLIKDLELPELVDGQAPVFDAGVQYGIRSVLVGVRVAQELSAMGVQQALPIINMAKEMRESEGQAAKIIAGELAQATLESNKQILAAIGQQAIAQSPNPMLTMMTQAMQPMLTQAMGNLMKAFTPKPGQPPGSLTPQLNQPGTEPAPSVDTQQATEEEVKEAFQ